MHQLWDAGIDYMTMTFNPKHHQRVKALLLIRAEMSKTASEQDKIIPGTMRGYIGEKQGKLLYGEKDGWLLVQVSGSRSRHIAQLFKDHGITGKATRIDFQATCQTSVPVERYLQEVSSKIEANTGAEKGRSARNSATYKNRGRACGMVIGSRSSENYTRLYNKTLEQRNRIAPNLARAEVELKGTKAELGWAMYMKSAQPYYYSCSMVKSDFMRYGIDLEWLAKGDKVEFESSWEKTTVQKQMNWLYTHVRPTVQKLVGIVGKEAVLDILGLD